MNAKESLIKNIKEWVKLDNELRQLKKEEKTRRLRKKELSASLIVTMRDNGIDEFDINNGKIEYQKKIVKQPITKKNLLTVLAKYYKGDINAATKANNFIMENREEKTVESITMKIND
mgnify:CR=1 FL=1